MIETNQKKLAIVCNSLAAIGKAIGLAEKISKDLINRKIDHQLFIKDWPKDFELFTDVIIVGGDGTLNYFINQYPDIKIPLFIFNGGTGNDFHRMLYGNKSFNELMNVALTGVVQPIDLGKCNDRYFINGVGIGFEGEVTKGLIGKKKILGKTSFMITILRKIMTYRSKDYLIKSAEKEITGKKLLISVCNGRWVGGGFFIAPSAKPNDGLFEVVISESLNSFQRLRWLPVIEKGKHMKLPFIQHFTSNKISVESNVPIQSHLDGEYLEADKIEIELLSGKMLFRI